MVKFLNVIEEGVLFHQLAHESRLKLQAVIFFLKDVSI